MSTEQVIQKAIKEISLAEALADEARATYYRARKTLEQLSAPASPKRGKQALDDKQIAQLLGKRKKNMMKSNKKTAAETAVIQ